MVNHFFMKGVAHEQPAYLTCPESEHVRRNHGAKALLEERSEYLDREVDQPGEVRRLEWADVHEGVLSVGGSSGHDTRDGAGALASAALNEPLPQARVRRAAKHCTEEAYVSAPLGMSDQGFAEERARRAHDEPDGSVGYLARSS